ncbi:O-methyltransferase [Mycena belliarum]|uniref:O-methyltransferase n=1 Tax=Mycena belliarum TaxID=1033014 RepID=A0AAD6XVF9_9AGAR|nr:O-methyltransferase [Mycena belliae]
MASTLIELSHIISSSVAAVDARCKALSRTYPNLNNPANSEEDESLAHDTEIVSVTNIVLAAAAQLIASVQLPSRAILDTSRSASASHMCRSQILTSSQFVLSAAMSAISESATAEIIREAGPQGCHINEIGKKNGVDPLKIGRLLRPLASQHIFREVSPGVFAHNRRSILLDTGKSSKEILAKRYHGAQGMSALVELNADECFKAASYIKDVVVHPTPEPTSALSRAFNYSGNLFNWYGRPENKIRFRRFGMAMDVTRKFELDSPTLKGACYRRFNWAALPPKTLVVDVGGGVGSTALEIARIHPHLRFLVQDLEEVTLEGKEFWAREHPTALTNGTIAFQAHNFLSPQPVADAGVFLVRAVLHNWAHSNAYQILTHLRAAAQPTTRLVLLERIVPFVCGEDGGDGAYAHIPGAVPATAQEPLLANLGVMMPYLMDIQARSLHLAEKNRSLTGGCHWKLLREAGWDIEHVYRSRPGMLDQIVAQPI